MPRDTIVVCGATGHQGGGAVDALLADDRWDVVALSRAPDGPAASALRDRGARVIEADLQDGASLRRAFSGARGVFGVTQPWSADYRKCYPAREVEQGRNIIAACKDAGVAHLIYSSVLLVGERGPTGIDHVDSKLQIEDAITGSGLSHTILRPVAFMDMLGGEFFPIKERWTLGLLDRDVKMPWVACADIGRAAAAVFSAPNEFAGKELGLVGDFISGTELAEALGRLKGTDNYRYRRPPRALVWLLVKLGLMAPDFFRLRDMYTRWGTPPHPPEIAEAMAVLRGLHPGVMSVEEHLRRRGVGNKAAEETSEVARRDPLQHRSG